MYIYIHMVIYIYINPLVFKHWYESHGPSSSVFYLLNNGVFTITMQEITRGFAGICLLMVWSMGGWNHKQRRDVTLNNCKKSFIIIFSWITTWEVHSRFWRLCWAFSFGNRKHTGNEDLPLFQATDLLTASQRGHRNCQFLSPKPWAASD